MLCNTVSAVGCVNYAVCMSASRANNATSILWAVCSTVNGSKEEMFCFRIVYIFDRTWINRFFIPLCFAWRFIALLESISEARRKKWGYVWYIMHDVTSNQSNALPSPPLLGYTLATLVASWVSSRWMINLKIDPFMKTCSNYFMLKSFKLDDFVLLYVRKQLYSCSSIKFNHNFTIYQFNKRV